MLPGAGKETWNAIVNEENQEHLVESNAILLDVLRVTKWEPSASNVDVTWAPVAAVLFSSMGSRDCLACVWLKRRKEPRLPLLRDWQMDIICIPSSSALQKQEEASADFVRRDSWLSARRYSMKTLNPVEKKSSVQSKAISVDVQDTSKLSTP